MKIYSFEDSLNLSLDEIKKLYQANINAKQTEILNQFPFNKHLFVKAKGINIYDDNNQKFYDFSGGIGVLGLGHNHDKIIKARINFQNQNFIEVHKLYFSRYLAALSNNL